MATRIRGKQLKNQTIKKEQIGNNEITANQIATETITNQQISPTAEIEQTKIQNLVDDLNSKLDAAGGTVSGTLTIDNPPVNPTDAVNKEYVDSISTGSRSLLLQNYNLLDDNLLPKDAPFSTVLLGPVTQSNYDNLSNFINNTGSNYSVFTNTVCVPVGSNKFLYQLGGSQGTQVTQIRNVSKSIIDINGVPGVFSSVNVSDLPENSSPFSKGAVVETLAGTCILFAKGNGDNLIWRSGPINGTTGEFTGWSLLTPLPSNTGDPQIQVATISGVQVAYILENDSPNSSDLQIAVLDNTGNVVSYTLNTLPQSVNGKMTILDNKYLYVVGTGTDSDKLFTGTINQMTYQVTWTNTFTTLPTGLTNFEVMTYQTSDNNNKLVVYGGNLNGTLQSTIYEANINILGIVGTFNPITSTLTTPTEGFGLSKATVGDKQYTYITGGRRNSGFTDTNTLKLTTIETTFQTVRRDIDAGTFYNVNKSADNRNSQSFVIQPSPLEDPTLTKPINVYYYANKDQVDTNYVISRAAEPTVPEDLSSPERLLIRIDQIDPISGNVISLPVHTTALNTSDYLQYQPLIKQVFNIDLSKISTTMNSITFDNEAFVLGNLRKIFKTELTVFNLLANGTWFVYWSNYQITLVNTEDSAKILLGKLVVDGINNAVFTSVATNLTYLVNGNYVVANNSSLTVFHGFNTLNTSVQISIDSVSGVLIDHTNFEIVKPDLNTILIKNISGSSKTIKQILIKKEV